MKIYLGGKFRIFVICFFSFFTSANTQNDSLVIIELRQELQNIKKEQIKFQKEVESLNADRKSAKLWLTILGFPLASLSLYILYLNFFGIKKKAEQETKTAAESALKNAAPSIILNELEKHPVVKEFKRIEEIKKRPILVLNSMEKDARFDKFLISKGFTNTKHRQIKNILDIDVNDFKLVLFNNEDGELEQEEMDSVIKEFKHGLFYFYFKGKGKQWSNVVVEMAGFATTKERLENNLINALEKK